MAITFYSTGLTLYGEHVTADLQTLPFARFNDSQLGSFSLTNAIIQSANLVYCNGCANHNVPSATISTNSVYYTTTPSGTVFTNVGGASYYLATNSPCRGVGTTSINPVVLADIRQKTTQPPLVYSNGTISTNITFSTVAQRDTNSSPDLGYHYDPVDVALGGVNLGGTITVTVNTNTIIAAFVTNGGYYGPFINSGSQFICQGTPTALNRIVVFNTVQELSTAVFRTANFTAAKCPLSGQPSISSTACLSE
jgi:hypothetical protein